MNKEEVMSKGKQNNYKEIVREKRMQKRGQVAIFIIVAILIVVVGILFYFFYPNIFGTIRGEVTPNTYLKNCIDSEFTSGVQLLAKQGGFRDPEGYIVYRGNKVKYLCYNAEYYLPCKVQEPMVKQRFEEELKEILKIKASECVDEMKQEYQSKGYSVTLGEGDVNVLILPGRIDVIFKNEMTMKKDETQVFKGFSVSEPSEMYNLLMISTSIVDYEAVYGNSETTLYTSYYPNVDIEKMELSDGSRVYTLNNINTGETFTFASRSVAWPPGYGTTT